MKLFRLAFFSRFWLAMSMLGSLCFYSCKDEVDHLSTTAPISFTFEMDASWASASRSVENSAVPRDTVTVLQGAPMQLYLHTLYTDSIVPLVEEMRSDTAVHARAVPVISANMYDAFGVSAYTYADTWDESLTPNYMYDVTVRKSEGVYAPATTYYWPGAAYKIKFFAYAPQGNTQYVLSDAAHAGAPAIDVTVPSDVSDQKDLLVAQSTELTGDNNTAVSLAFKHALTAVKFVCGADMQAGTIKSIQLKNIYSKGTYQLGTSSWTDPSTPVTFSQTIHKATTGTAGEAIVAEAQTFMMMPQTLPDNA